MKPIHVFQLSVFVPDDCESMDAGEIQEAIKTELNGTYYLDVFDIKWQGIIRTDEISHEE
jgi:hypothetical protein